jgi:hypothetical protein
VVETLLLRSMYICEVFLANRYPSRWYHLRMTSIGVSTDFGCRYPICSGIIGPKLDSSFKSLKSAGSTPDMAAESASNGFGSGKAQGRTTMTSMYVTGTVLSLTTTV